MRRWICLLAAGVLWAQPPGGMRQRPGGFGGPGGTPGVRGGPGQGQAQTAAGVPGSQEEKPPTPPEDLCRIEGRVTAMGSGEPLRKASVMLTPVERQPGWTPYTAGTGEDGSFAMKDIEPGRYRLSVMRNGYVRLEYGARGPGRPGATLNLNRGQRLTDVNFALLKQSVITGRVVDEDGEPVSRASVYASRYSWIQGRKVLRPYGFSQTDDRGIYRIHDLPAGKYLVAASPMAMGFDWMAQSRSAQEEPEESYTPTYYPGTTDAATAAQVETGVGTETQGIDIRMIKVQTVRVRGRVVNPFSTRPGRTMVTLFPKGVQAFSSTDRRPAMVDRRGNFEFRGVAPGTYVLSANYFEGGNRYAAQVSLDVGRSPVEGITLTIGPGEVLEGTLKVEGDAALPAGTDLRVALESRDAPMFGAAIGEVKDDLSFKVSNVPLGASQVRLAGLPSGFYLKAARYGQEDVLAHGLDLTQGAAGKLELTISPAAARVEGVVLDAKQQPVKGASVVLAPASAVPPGRADLYRSATSDQNGQYRLEGVPPGKYRLFAFEDLEEGAYQDVDFLKQHETKAEKLELAERDSASKQLALIPVEALAAAAP